MSRIASAFRRPKTAVVLGVVLVIALGGFAYATFSGTVPNIPTVEVRKGDLVEYVQLRGELKALKSITLNAPTSAGQLQIIQLAKNGAMVKQGDPVAVFDPTQLQSTLDQKRSDLKQAQADLENVRAQSRMTEQQDITNLEKARYDVERAKLEVGKQEILSAIDAGKAKLSLADTEQALKQAQEKLKADKQGAAADLAGKQQKIDKANYDVKDAETSLSKLVLKAPANGMITLLTTWRGAGNSSEFRDGDRAWPGAAIAQLPDLSSIAVSGRIDETDRGRLKLGQTVSVRIDAVPDREFTGSISQISPLTKADFTSWPIQRNFDVQIALKDSDPRLRPGMSATARIAVDRVSNTLIIPAEAAFDRSGRSVAYVLSGKKFREHSIEIARRANGEVAVARGLSVGEKVATRDPNAQGAAQ